MIVIDGYSIIHYVARNQIVITLPQTRDTLTTSRAPISYRRKALTDLEEARVLAAVKYMFENEPNMDGDDNA